MKKIILAIIGTLLIIFLAVGYLSSYLGWYGYEKWKDRKATQTVEESVKRKVFIKELYFKVDSFYGRPFYFKPYIEKGFKYGHDSAKETFPLEGTEFPFQLSFNYKPDSNITVLIRKNQLQKFDSSNASWGYLKQPKLTDTIILEIHGENIKSGIIKVWQ